MDIRNHYADQNEKTEAFAGEHLYKWPKNSPLMMEINTLQDLISRLTISLN